MSFIYYMEKIYYLEDRGGWWIYHFLVYNLGGLFHILKNNHNTFEELKYPIKIYMKDILQFQREAFKIIEDKFKLVEDLNEIENYELVKIHGETDTIDGYGDNRKDVFPFLRNLFLEKCKFEIVKHKRIFITRKKSEIYHYGVLKRYILNEDEVIKMLNKYNFEYIQLEDYNFYDKIKLFMESEIILSSHSGALSFTMFSNKESKIIEIIKSGTRNFLNEHYKNIAEILGNQYYRYSEITEDSNGNFNLPIDEFEKYLLSIM